MMKAISNTAEFGAYQAGPRIIDAHARQKLREILGEIRSGEFAESVQSDHARGFECSTSSEKR